MRLEDLGSYYIDREGHVWRLITYADAPTATLQRVDDPQQRRGGVVGSPIFDDFVRLRPEREFDGVAA